MRWLLIGIGILFNLIGLVWFLQGIGIVGGSFMTGQSFWSVVGAVGILVGDGLIVLGVRRGLRR